MGYTGGNSRITLQMAILSIISNHYTQENTKAVKELIELQKQIK